MTARRFLTITVSIVLLGAGLLPTPAFAATITVNSFAHDVSNDGECTLREAITASNTNTASGGATGECPAGFGSSDTIDFNLTGTPPHVIDVSTAILPPITAPVTIDGYCATCDGATPPTATGPATITIVIDGGTSLGGDGLEIQSTGGGSTIQGVAILDFNGDPIEIDNSDNNTIRGSHIAAGATGLTGATCHDAVNIQPGSSNNVVGGSTPADRNVIGGCSGSSLLIVGVGTNQNVVSGNYIGIGANGTTSLGNASDTIFIGVNADQNTIGGDTVGERNVIGGGQAGVHLSDPGTDGNAVLGNYIGTTASGTDGGTIDNAWGVEIDDGPTATQVSDNLIAFNNQDGVVVKDAGSVANPITRNAIHSNTGLGIDLGDDGVTENDIDDVDSGPNGLQNYPELQQVLAASTTTTFTGTLNSESSTQYLLHFYANDACDPSGNGEGQRFVGSAQVTTDPGGDASFSASVPGTVSPGDLMTATATEQGSGGSILHTSEFSDCLAAQAAPTRDSKLKAKPKRVDKGERTKLTGTLDQCTSFAVIEFQRKRKGEFQTFKTRSAPDCDASTRVRMKKKTAFRIFAPPDGGFDETTSKPVKVKIKPE